MSLPQPQPTPTPHGARLVTDLTRWQHGKGYWRPSRGVRLPLEEHGFLARCEAVNIVSKRTVVFSGLSAIRLCDGVEDRDDDLEVTVGADDPLIVRPGVRCRRRQLDQRDVTDLHGLAVTTPQRTFVDVASQLKLPRLVAVGDDFLRRDLCSGSDIAEVLDRSRGQRGVRRARQALALLDPRAESPRESVLRIMLLEMGFPAPTPQVDIVDEMGQFIARGDLVYIDKRIVIEYDGEHHLTRETQAKDAARRGKLAVNDWLVVTVVGEDISHPPLLRAKVSAAFRSRSHLPSVE